MNDYLLMLIQKYKHKGILLGYKSRSAICSRLF